MKVRLLHVFLLCLISLPGSAAFAFIQDPPDPLSYDKDNSELFIRIDEAIYGAVYDGSISGAVVCVGHEDGIIYEMAYGKKTQAPESEPMTIDTIFDIASLTKVIATAPAVMRLVENKLLSLDKPIGKYLPEAGGKSHCNITLRQLLTHYSGLPANLTPVKKKKKKVNKSAPGVLQRIYSSPLRAKPGRRFIYSDLGFVILGKIIENVSGESLDRFVSGKIFSSLEMNNTVFRPDGALKERIAPSEQNRNGEYKCGSVQDPLAGRLGGVAGHAGLFSTAGDLSRFARMILNNGSLDGQVILKPESVAAMTSKQSPKGKKDIRGLGWDIDSRYSAPKGQYFSSSSFGHTGYTGTSIWIDRKTRTYVILLTSRPNLRKRSGILDIYTRLSDIVGSMYSEIADGNKGVASKNV